MAVRFERIYKEFAQSKPTIYPAFHAARAGYSFVSRGSAAQPAHPAQPAAHDALPSSVSR